MRASMRADGTTCRSRYNPVVTTGLCGTERIMDDPNSVVAGVETTVVTPTRGRLVLLRPSGWSWAGETVETCTSPASPAKGIYHQCSRLRNWRHKLGKMRVMDCGEHVHYWSSPQSEYQIQDFGVETPLCHDGLVQPRQAVCYHIEAARNVSGSQSYVLSL